MAGVIGHACCPAPSPMSESEGLKGWRSKATPLIPRCCFYLAATAALQGSSNRTSPQSPVHLRHTRCGKARKELGQCRASAAPTVTSVTPSLRHFQVVVVHASLLWLKQQQQPPPEAAPMPGIMHKAPASMIWRPAASATWLLGLLALATLTTALAAAAAPQPQQKQRPLATALPAAWLMAKVKARAVASQLPTDRYPLSTPQGSSGRSTWEATPAASWTSGFWPGARGAGRGACLTATHSDATPTSTLGEGREPPRALPPPARTSTRASACNPGLASAEMPAASQHPRCTVCPFRPGRHAVAAAGALW